MKLWLWKLMSPIFSFFSKEKSMLNKKIASLEDLSHATWCFGHATWCFGHTTWRFGHATWALDFLWMVIIEKICGIYTPNLLLLIQVENPSPYYKGIAVASSVFESVHKSNQLENDTKASGMSNWETLIDSQEKNRTCFTASSWWLLALMIFNVEIFLLVN